MANIYLRSATGNNANSGASWALAKATLAGAFAVAAPGDTIYAAHNHNEAFGSLLILVSPGTFANPVKVICVVGTGDPTPPTTLATTAIVSSTNGWGLVLSAGVTYCNGVTFVCDASNSNYVAGLEVGYSAGLSPTQWTIENGGVIQQSASTGSYISVGAPALPAKGNLLRLKNSVMRFYNASQKYLNDGDLIWEGGSLNTASAVPTVLVDASEPSAGTGKTVIRGVDLSGMGAGKSLVNVAGPRQSTIDFANCKLGSGVALTTGAQTALSGPVVTMTNCDSADTTHRSQSNGPCGSVFSETTVIRTGGASDGTTGLSWRMASGANASYPMNVLASPEIVKWNDATGSAVTITVEIVHDSQGAGSGGNFQDDEMWLEVQYLGAAGFPLSSFISDAKAGILATAVNQASSTEPWTTTGLTAPVKQKLSVTLTPQEKGFIHARVMLARASRTMYACPKLAVA